MQELPLFPLNLFLLPGEFSQLYIFEERYKQMINECLEESKPFGIPFTDKLNTANLGSLVGIKEVVDRQANGEMEIVIEAMGHFKLQQFFYQHQPKIYPGGRVTLLSPLQDRSSTDELQKHFQEFLIGREIYDVEIQSKTSDNLYEIAHFLQMTPHEKMEIAQMKSKVQVSNYLLNYLRYLELLHEQENYVYQNFYLN